MDNTRLRIGHGHDIHALHVGFPLCLGGVVIHASERGFNTHSDGDVLCHALIDALAGAMADGDLGTHYSEDDPNAWDAYSLDFVNEFMTYARERGYELVNIDSHLTLGTLKLRPYIDAMRQNLAKAMAVDLDRVSVKARSHDGLGPLGKGDAISATVTVLVEKRAD